MSQTNVVQLPKKSETYKIFEEDYNGENKKFAVIKTKSSDIEDANIEYARMFNLCVKKGIATNNRLLQDLIKSGSWSNENQERIAILEQVIDEGRIELEKIRKSSNPSDMDKQYADELIDKIKTSLNELNEFIMERNDLLGNSADAKAEESRRAYLIATSVYKVKTVDNKDVIDERLWKNYSEYQDDSNMIFKAKAFMQYIYFVGNIDFTERTIENRPHPWQEILPEIDEQNETEEKGNKKAKAK